MGLVFPRDLESWSRWQSSRNPLRRLRSTVTPQRQPTFFLSAKGAAPSVLVAVDATTPTAVAAYLQPLQYLPEAEIAILTQGEPSFLGSQGWLTVPQGLSSESALNDTGMLNNLKAIYSGGHFLPAGHRAWLHAQRHDIPFVIVQHGLLTPFAPPLPEGAHVLGFSERDIGFWASGRPDISGETVGSQLLWAAAQQKSDLVSTTQPTFLGQLHGAELSRRISARTALTFCERTGARYRPHPSETDKLSRLQHKIWRRRGVTFDDTAASVIEARRPVVSIFSTGVLEAAAAGIPSWVTIIRPVEWVDEFWERYELAPWGGDPTPAPPTPPQEPARAIAQALSRIIESSS
jgi:hypothetical protein